MCSTLQSKVSMHLLKSGLTSVKWNIGLGTQACLVGRDLGGQEMGDFCKAHHTGLHRGCYLQPQGLGEWVP